MITPNQMMCIWVDRAHQLLYHEYIYFLGRHDLWLSVQVLETFSVGLQFRQKGSGSNCSAHVTFCVSVRLHQVFPRKAFRLLWQVSFSHRLLLL